MTGYTGSHARADAYDPAEPHLHTASNTHNGAYTNPPSHTHSQTYPYFYALTRTPSRFLRRNPVLPLVGF